MKVIEAVAPVVVDCLAESPLHPQLASLFVHVPAKVTAALESSTRMPAVGSVGVGVGVGAGADEEPPPPPPPQEIRRNESNRAGTRGI